MLTLKENFVQITNCQTWRDAMDKFPAFAREEKLEMFMGEFIQ